MVINVTQNNISIDEFFHNVDTSIENFIHELNMSELVYKYNFLQENGITINEADSNASKKSIIDHIKSFFAFIGNQLKRMGTFIVNKLKAAKAKIMNSTISKRLKSEYAQVIDDATVKANGTVEKKQSKVEKIKQSYLDRTENVLSRRLDDDYQEQPIEQEMKKDAETAGKKVVEETKAEFKDIVEDVEKKVNASKSKSNDEDDEEDVFTYFSNLTDNDDEDDIQ